MLGPVPVGSDYADLRKQSRWDVSNPPKSVSWHALIEPRFRWAQLAIAQITQQPDRIDDILLKIPKGLAEAYQDLYDNLEEQDREYLHKTLLLAAYGARPLTVNEVVEAIAERFFDKPNLLLRRRVLRVSSQFIAHDPETDRLRVTHLSVREFMEQHHSFPTAIDAHNQLLNICETFLTPFFDEHSPREKRIWDLGHFIAYAITMMPFHRKITNPHLDIWHVWDKFQVQLRLDGFHTKYRNAWLESYDRTTFDMKHKGRILTPLDTLFDFGLMDIVSDDMRAVQGAWNFSDSAYEPSLRYLCRWYTAALFADDQLVLGTSLITAVLKTPYAVEQALSGDVEVLSALVRHGAVVQRPDGSGSSALHMATAMEYTQAAEVLLRHGANPNITDDLGRTPLHHNVESHTYRETQITELLIGSGANVDQMDPVTPMCTTFHGHRKPAL